MSSSLVSSNAGTSSVTASTSHHQNNLDFSVVGTHLRDKAISGLHEIYKHVQTGGSSFKSQDGETQDSNKPTIALITGAAGTGKSTVAKQFMDQLEQRSSEEAAADGPVKPFFLHGKFDDISVDPFSAIIEAFNGLGSLLTTPEEADELKRVRKEVITAMGNEAEFLSTVIPGLKDVTGTCASNPIGNNEHAPNRLKYVFQNFVNAISTKERPVVLLLDDLQWCDTASASLLEALLTDGDLRYLMFIGCFRPDEMTEESPFYQVLEAIEKSQHVSKTELTNLTESETTSFVADILNVEKDTIAPLADMVFSKTQGNLVFAKQVLDEMCRKGLLVFSPETLKWNWKLENVDDKLSGSIIESITQKLKKMPFKMQKAMTITAYTRNGIDFSTLYKLIELDGNNVDPEFFTKLLDKAVLEGHLMNSMGSSKYFFAHDRIRQAAYALVPEGLPRSTFRFKLGERLYRMGMEDGGDNWMIYVAADHVNATARELGQDSIFPIRVNLEAGERATSCAAFETAAKYLGFALQEILRLSDPWESHYDLTLKVYQTIVDVKLCQGHLQVGKAIGDEVLQKAKRVEDKMPVQLAMSKALGREERHKESAEMSVATLQLLKQYPRGVLSLHASLTKDFLYIKRYLKKKSDKEILNLPTMTDKKQEYVMAFLASNAYQSFYCGNLVGFMVGTLRMLRISIKYGLCDTSTFAVTGYCLFCLNVNDMEGAARFAELARKILTRFNAKHLESLQIFVVAYWMTSWKSNEEVLKLYDRAYKSGMETGDFENGLLSRTASIYHEFNAGYYLGNVDEKFANLVRKLQVYKVDAVLGMTIQQRFVGQYLMGTATMDLKTFEIPENSDSSSTYRLIYCLLARLQLGVFFGDYEFALEMAEKLAPLAEFENSHAVRSLGIYFTSLTYAMLARTRNKKSYGSKARRRCNQLISLCNSKGENSRHRCMLLEAQLLSLNGQKPSLVQSSFDDAINMAIQGGYKQDAGLGSVLAAEHFLSLEDSVLKSPILQKARDLLVGNYITEAYEMYDDWGANALVDSIQQKYGKYLDIASTQLSAERRVFQGGLADGDLLSISQRLLPEGKEDDVSVLSNHSAGWKLRQKTQ
ncbi:unnamed protein product [Cylindrotheca closterium]|uniref:Orc1-like AAA ATPase domain-containing protein n=1 Tax=Cylindrotheca closterium TaxID=2856 RepID=A0AAD2FXW7_9STRA|nr:unnamed protein product [Cylindrotheca closterium]